MIGFNKPYFSGSEAQYIIEAVNNGHISGNGAFSRKCELFFQERYGFSKCLLTTSCTAALEMAALLIDTKEGDEIIMPSYTFVSTANAFVLRGAKIVFVDSELNNPNLDVEAIEKLITPKTKALVVVHYGGIACDMDRIMNIANRHNLLVIEDAAQAVDSYFKEQPLGSIGHLAAMSFHETKNVSCGEGGMLIINDEKFIERAENLREKGTNRPAFFKGEVSKYTWVDIGSSYLPSDILAAILYAQINLIDRIQTRRKEIFSLYFDQLKELREKGVCELPVVPNFAASNGHLFYLVCKDQEERDRLIQYLNEQQINAVFHYQSLHSSPFYEKKYSGDDLPNCDRFSSCLLRLPFYIELQNEQILFICSKIKEFFNV